MASRTETSRSSLTPIAPDCRTFMPYDTLTFTFPDRASRLFVVRGNPVIPAIHEPHDCVLFLETPELTRKDIARLGGKLDDQDWTVSHLLYAPCKGYGQPCLDELPLPFSVRALTDAYLNQPLNTTAFQRKKIILDWISLTGALPPSRRR